MKEFTAQPEVVLVGLECCSFGIVGQCVMYVGWCTNVRFAYIVRWWKVKASNLYLRSLRSRADTIHC